MVSANRESELEKSKKLHQENREASNAYTNKYINNLRNLINDYKKAGACIRCGAADYRVLDFHHIDPSQKKFHLNTAWKTHLGPALRSEPRSRKVDTFGTVPLSAQFLRQYHAQLCR